MSKLEIKFIGFRIAAGGGGATWVAVMVLLILLLSWFERARFFRSISEIIR
jgi:site-specific recombinase